MARECTGSSYRVLLVAFRHWKMLRTMEGEVTEPQRKMRPRDAARFIGIAVSTLARMRARGNGPPFSKLPSSRVIVYDREEIEKWLRKNCNQLQKTRGDRENGRH